MLTLFSLPKPFNGKVGVAQRNSIQSWLRLDPEIEVILFGDDHGIKEVSKEFKIRHEGNIPVSAGGVPLLNEVFRRVELLARHRLLCFVCADIILTFDFPVAVQRISNMEKFLLTGRRFDLNVTEALDFQNLNWEKSIRELVDKPNPAKGMDYFVYPKGIWGKVPDFIIGRPYPDNWFIFKARHLRVPLIDATQVILPIHHSHEVQGRGHTSEEIIWNKRLAEVGIYFNTDDATHLLTSSGMEMKKRSWLNFVRFMDSEMIMKFPRFYPLVSLAEYRRAMSPSHLFFAPFRRIKKSLRWN